MLMCVREGPLRKLAETAAGDDAFAGDPLRVVGRKEGGDGCDVVHLARAAEGSLRDESFLEVRTNETCGLSTFGIDDAGVDGVDADLPRAEFLCEDASDGIQCTFGAGVYGTVGRGKAADARANVDDTGSFAEVLDGCTCGEKHAKDVDVEDLVEL